VALLLPNANEQAGQHINNLYECLLLVLMCLSGASCLQADFTAARASNDWDDDE
jgi:hypothetical protein